MGALVVEVEIRRAAPEEANLAYAIVSEYYDAAAVVARDTEEAFATEYFELRSGFWLASVGAEIAGCVALRSLAPESAEIKRMYLRSRWRGQGIAEKLLEAAEHFAKGVGYTWIYLDTAKEMHAAAQLYRRSGYQLCDRYNDNPQAAIFMRKNLEFASTRK